MVARARATGLFDRLEVADLVEFLDREPAGVADLVIAADALGYIGDLTPVFIAVARALRRDGLFVLTAEAKTEVGYELGPTLRFRHSRVYLEAIAVAAGLRARLSERASARREAGVDVPGLVLALDLNR